MTWGWRIPFLIALVLAIVAVILRRQLEESEEFTTTRAMQVEAGGKKANPLVEAFRHPKNAILGILIGLPQSIAGYVVLTFGLAYLVNAKHIPAQVGFVGTMIVGILQVFVAPAWGAVSDRVGRRQGVHHRLHRLRAPRLADLHALRHRQHVAHLAGHDHRLRRSRRRHAGHPADHAVRDVRPGGAHHRGEHRLPDLQHARRRARPVDRHRVVAAASGAIWPVVVYVAVICIVGAIATATATIHPDVEGAARLHALAATTAPVR